MPEARLYEGLPGSGGQERYFVLYKGIRDT
jgi:hypothetical protein